MKKLLGLLIAWPCLALGILMAWPTTADANVLDNVDVIGEIETIGVENNYRAKTETGFSGAASRVMAGLSAQLTEDVKANVLFDYSTEWIGSLQGDNLQHYWDNVRLAEANVVLSNLFDCFELTVGRQFYGEEGNALIYIGPRHGYVTALRIGSISLDAAKLTYSDDFKSVTLVAGKIGGRVTSSGIAIDGWTLSGADVRLNLTNDLNAQVYGYVLHDNAYEGMEYRGFYGAKLAFAPQAGLLSAEYARGFAGDRLIKESHNTPYLVKVDGALHLDAFTPRATFFYQKGNVSSGLGDYVPGLVYGKNLNFNDLANLRIYNVGVDYALSKWTFSVDGFAFQDRTAKHEANLEADFTVNYQHNENVSLFAGIGYLKKSNTDNDYTYNRDQQDITVYQAGLNVKF